MATSPAYSAIGNRLLKLTVILLCSINALMWEYYTESQDHGDYVAGHRCRIRNLDHRRHEALSADRPYAVACWP